MSDFECPNCGNGFSASEIDLFESGYVDCSGCEASFYVEVGYNPSFSVSRADCKDGYHEFAFDSANRYDYDIDTFCSWENSSDEFWKKCGKEKKELGIEYSIWSIKCRFCDAMDLITTALRAPNPWIKEGGL